jgi:uncharacterized protein (DUF952 family)
MQKIYHIVPEQLWREHKSGGEYRGDTLDSEGFIHCSTEEQVIRTANRVFRGRDGLVVLRIDPSMLVSRLVYEDTSGAGEDFPHIYGPLNIAAVEGSQQLRIGADGLFEQLSWEWSAC